MPAELCLHHVTLLTGLVSNEAQLLYACLCTRKQCKDNRAEFTAVNRFYYLLFYHFTVLPVGATFIAS